MIPQRWTISHLAEDSAKEGWGTRPLADDRVEAATAPDGRGSESGS